MQASTSIHSNTYLNQKNIRYVYVHLNGIKFEITIIKEENI